MAPHYFLSVINLQFACLMLSRVNFKTRHYRPEAQFPIINDVRSITHTNDLNAHTFFTQHKTLAVIETNLNLLLAGFTAGKRGVKKSYLYQNFSKMVFRILLTMSLCARNERIIQLDKRWTDLDETWYGRYAIGAYPAIVLFNFLPRWQKNEHVRWDTSATYNRAKQLRTVTIFENAQL